jgi:hypothetical protein
VQRARGHGPQGGIIGAPAEWAEIESTAEPTAVTERPDGTIEVAVHLVARDKKGKMLSEVKARHVYEFRGDLVARMTIQD